MPPKGKYAFIDLFARCGGLDRRVLSRRSCDEIDRAYFREIRSVVSDHVQWICHYHTNNDKKNMLSMVDELSIKDFDLKFI